MTNLDVAKIYHEKEVENLLNLSNSEMFKKNSSSISTGHDA